MERRSLIALAGSALFTGCSARAFGYSRDEATASESNMSSKEEEMMEFVVKNLSGADVLFTIKVSDSDGGIVSQEEIDLHGTTSERYNLALDPSEDYNMKVEARVSSDNAAFSVGGSTESGYKASFDAIPISEQFSPRGINKIAIQLTKEHNLQVSV